MAEAEAAFEHMGWSSLYAYAIRKGWFTKADETPMQSVFRAKMVELAKLYSQDCIYQ
jgi:hypothetical protein